VPDAASKLQKKFGEALRIERKRLKLSQEQLALEAGISMTYVGEIERGEKMASLEVVVRLAKALGMTGSAMLARAAL
jgi:transcriptional regulator with XRE-family HTH domain